MKKNSAKPGLRVETNQNQGAASSKKIASPGTDLYEWGLSGKPGSAERKARLLNALGLPPRLSKKELVEAFNRLYTFEQLDELQLKILQE